MRTVSSLVVVGLLAAASTVPAEVPQILSYENNNDGHGNYNFSFKTSDGIERQEQSEVVNAGVPEKEYLRIRGSYSYIGPDDVTYKVTYSADEKGFLPQGNHLPVEMIKQRKVQPVSSSIFDLGGTLSRSLTG